MPKKTKKQKTITIEVTADDIIKGVPGSDCECPVARALKRTLGTDDVTVSGDIRIELDGDFNWSMRGPVPKSVKDFIFKFDNLRGNNMDVYGHYTNPVKSKDRLKAVSPFSFELPWF